MGPHLLSVCPRQNKLPWPDLLPIFVAGLRVPASSYNGESSSLPPAAAEGERTKICFVAYWSLGGPCLSTKDCWLQRGDWVEVWAGWRQGEKCEARRNYWEEAEGGH